MRRKAVTPEALLQSIQFAKPAEPNPQLNSLSSEEKKISTLEDPLFSGKRQARIENVMVRISDEEGRMLQRIANAINARPEWGRSRNPAFATILRAGLRLLDPEAGHVDIAKSASIIAETAIYKRRGN